MWLTIAIVMWQLGVVDLLKDLNAVSFSGVCWFLLGSQEPLMCRSATWWVYLVRTVRKCRLLCPSKSPDGLCSLFQSAHKGDIIARAGWYKATAFGVLWSPPFPIAPILSHSMLTDYTPLPHCPIIPLQQQANLSIQLGSRLPACCVI